MDAITHPPQATVVLRASSSTPEQRLPRLYRHLGLWVLQAWVSMFYIAAGYAKLSQSHGSLTLLMTWPGRVDLDWVRLVGVIEISLSLGLLAPLLSWARCRVVLLAAALTLTLEATAMAVFHATQSQAGLVLTNALLTVMAATVVVGRWMRTTARRGWD